MDHADEFPVTKMSKVLRVGRSSYYDWLKNKDKYLKKEELTNQIKAIFEKSRFTYGSPRIHQELEKLQVKISESTVARRMKELSIRPILKKRYRTTTDSKHDLKISPNLLDREFTVTELGKKWVSDITYV